MGMHCFCAQTQNQVDKAKYPWRSLILFNFWIIFIDAVQVTRKETDTTGSSMLLTDLVVVECQMMSMLVQARMFQTRFCT